jgi:hypothetical protein
MRKTENNLNDVEVLRYFEAGTLKPAPRLAMADGTLHPDAEVPRCAE